MMRGRDFRYNWFGNGILIPILMIIFGVLVIIFPQIIAWIIGLYLIINGLIFLIRYI
ncbi:MAG: hypothetical protein J7J36_00430 [Thermoplasmata archaeon]|nr:hypothetical protein [Thermoplasmata archaeon]